MNAEVAVCVQSRYAKCAYAVGSCNVRAWPAWKWFVTRRGYDGPVTSRSADRCVNTLRVKIKPAPKRPRFIQAVRPIGCRFEIE